MATNSNQRFSALSTRPAKRTRRTTEYATNGLHELRTFVAQPGVIVYATMHDSRTGMLYGGEQGDGDQDHTSAEDREGPRETAESWRMSSALAWGRACVKLWIAFLYKLQTPHAAVP